MRSSSTEKGGFWPGNAGAWARLALVVMLGVGALVAPAVGVGKTGAIYTDSETAGFDVGTSAPPASPAPTDTAMAADPTPTADPSTAPAAPAAALAALSAPSGGATASPNPQPTPTTQATGRGRAHTPGPVGPQKP